MTDTMTVRNPETMSIFKKDYIRIQGKRLGRMSVGEGWRRAFEKLTNGELLEACAFRGNGYGVIVTVDVTDKHGPLLHTSMSLKDRYPTWEELKDLKQVVFGPAVDVMQVIPKDADYVNLHPNTFHLWQTPETWDIS